MENTRIGTAEAIALILTITINHAISNISKTIILSTNSSALLNTIYVSIIALILSYIIYLLLNKFPTFDIIDISNFIGGKFLKVIVSILFFSYFIFFNSSLFKSFVYCLQIIYYPNTNTFFIIIAFLISSFFSCTLKYNAVFRSNLLSIPFVILSIVILFLGNLGDFTFENIFPVLGNGINETFFSGISNLFAYQGILYLLFLPPHLKNVSELRKITLISIIFSALYLSTSIAIVLLLFDADVSNLLIMPLYSAVRYIEFGMFFQRLDSVFILTWIISFVSYLSITIKLCSNILKKVIPMKSNTFFTVFSSLSILVVTFFSTSYAVSTFITNTVYKYAFFIILGISLSLLLTSYFLKSQKIKQQIRFNKLSGGIK